MEQSLLDISDGKLYTTNDMVKVECHDCKGCSSCCEDMGTSVLLDPYDVWQLTRNLGCSFDELLADRVELHMEEGLIYPNLRMQENGKCGFLDENGRCSIHAFRPGICRLFPLGRNYEPNRLQYFVLKDACPASGKTKVKVSKWMGVPGMKSYENYLVQWHNFTKQLREKMLQSPQSTQKEQTMLFLTVFYRAPYSNENFYEEFTERLAKLS